MQMDSGLEKNPFVKVQKKSTCEWSDFNKFGLISGIECPELSAPANGRVDVSGLRPGSRALYSCSPGFRLSGSERRTCQNNGQWSNRKPSCTGENLKLILNQSTIRVDGVLVL